MSKVVSILLEWKYSPETYLEAPILIKFDGVTLEIRDGIAKAAIEPDIFHANESIRDELTEKIKNRLYAVQIMTHKDFELTKSSRTDLREDGKKNHFVEVNSCVMTMSVGKADFIIHDKYGNVVSDTKRERLDKQKWFASLVDKNIADATLAHLLKSYQQSIRDSKNELVHLYEIRDALSKKFGSKVKAIRALHITNSEWDVIGRLANTLPLKQGRHRGQSVGALRDAKPYELEVARKSVVYLIEQYVKYLEM